METAPQQNREDRSSKADLPVSVEDLCFLANTFTEQGLYDKAIAIYESATRIHPDNLALKINLGRVRSLKNQSLDSPEGILQVDGETNPLEKLRWSNRFQGLAEILLRDGRRDDAVAVLELTQKNSPEWYMPPLLLGECYLEAGNYPKAIFTLERARKLNPFHEKIADLLSVARFQNRDYREALIAAVDAFILSGEMKKKQRDGKYRSKIKSIIEKIPQFSDHERNDLIRDRRDRIQQLYEELEAEVRLSVGPDMAAAVSQGKKPQEISEVSDEVKASGPSRPEKKPDPQAIYAMASRLKEHLIFRNMDDEPVLKVARFTSDLHIPKGEFVYQENDPVYGLYLVNRGKIEIQKATQYGPISYAQFESGSFFGDDNLMNGRVRYTSAVAVKDSDLLFIDKAGLATIFARERPIAIHFLWYFWKSLSFQIRESNDRMTGFFAGASDDKKRAILMKDRGISGGIPTHIEIDKKLEVLQSKGLNSNELKLLAKLSNEEMYNAGEAIFQEGDVGDRLYIVLEGSVLISKNIPGAGEEALATLKRGDFFGEMALVGQHQRSADAKAQEQGTTLLVITRDALREILSIDTHSAYQFLTILCHILSKRLQEMNEKIYQWRLMSGAFS